MNMLKIGKLPLAIYLQFYIKITSTGQKYGGFLIDCSYKNSTDFFVLDRYLDSRHTVWIDFKIESVLLKARRKKIKFYV